MILLCIQHIMKESCCWKIYWDIKEQDLQIHNFNIKKSSKYLDELDDIVNEYNNTYHRAIKMKPT